MIPVPSNTRVWLPAITNLKMSTTDSGHYHPLHLVGMAVTPDGYG